MSSVPKSNNFPACFHRVTIKGLAVKDGKILLFKEAPQLSGKWELPGGGLDFGEDIQDGLKREIEEESGIKVSKVSKHPIYAWTWRHENKRDMDWYYALVLAYKIELENLDFKITEECEEIGWFSKEELEVIELCAQTNGLKGVFDPNDFV
ncbi:MAG: NUDIX hydrolase [Candidatus Colwellbacteria bacterium]|nr:NUDIX hydrolase [Candidatus Colwellbacteria bacterium]